MPLASSRFKSALYVEGETLMLTANEFFQTSPKIDVVSCRVIYHDPEYKPSPKRREMSDKQKATLACLAGLDGWFTCGAASAFCKMDSSDLSTHLKALVRKHIIVSSKTKGRKMQYKVVYDPAGVSPP